MAMYATHVKQGNNSYHSKESYVSVDMVSALYIM